MIVASKIMEIPLFHCYGVSHKDQMYSPLYWLINNQLIILN